MKPEVYIAKSDSLKVLICVWVLLAMSVTVVFAHSLAGTIVVTALVSIYVIWFTYKRLDFQLFYPIAILVGTFWVYHTIYPILYLLDIPRSVDLPYVSYETVFKSAVLVLITALGFLISAVWAIRFSKVSKKVKHIVLPNIGSFIIIAIAVIFFLVGLLLYISGFMLSGISLSAIFTYFGTSYVRLRLTNMPDYYRNLVYAATVVVSSALMDRKSKTKVSFLLVLFYFLMVLYAFIQFVIGNRRETFIMLLLILVGAFEKLFRNFNSVRFLSLLLLMACLFFGFQYFVVLRSGHQLQDFDMKELIEFMFSNFDGNAPYGTICFYVQNGVPNFKYGFTYIYNPLYSVIGCLFRLPNYRLASPAVYFSYNYGEGIGWAFSPVTEAYINFGALGCLIFGIVFIYILYVFTLLFRNTQLYTLSILAAFVINRGDFTGFFTEVILTGVLVIFISCCALLFSKRSRNYEKNFANMFYVR